MATSPNPVADWQDYKPQQDGGWQDYKPATPAGVVNSALASIPKPQVDMKTSALGQAVYGPPGGDDSLKAAGYQGPDPSQINKYTSSAAMAAAPLALAGRAAAPVAGAIGRVAAKHPLISSLVIGEARHIPYVGRLIPPYAEMAPFLMKGGEGAQPEVAKPELEAPPEPAPTTTPKIGNPEKALRGQIDQMLNPSPDIKPGVPIRDQISRPVPEGFKGIDSSALRSYRYDPVGSKLSVQTNEGTIHTYRGVTQEEADAFAGAESKGKAWKDLRDNHPNEKIGKLKSLRHGEPTSEGVLRPEIGKPTAKSGPPAVGANEGDLTGVLQRSLDEIRKKRGLAQ